MKELKVMLSEGAFMPERKTEGAAGLDLFSPIDFEIPPSTIIGRAVDIGRFKVDTGVAVEIDPKNVGLIRPRSGLGFNTGVDAFDGTIDDDYRGTIGVMMYNLTPRPVKFKRGDRIAQLVILPIRVPVTVEVESLSETTRGTGGFGHTGK